MMAKTGSALSLRALGLVFLGGAVGTATRAWISGTSLTHLFPALTIHGDPGATVSSSLVSIWVINVCGALILGFLGARCARFGWANAKLLVGTGFCGGFTTYSTFAVDVVTLMSGHGLHAHPGTAGIVAAALYAVSMVVLGAVAAWVGIRLEESLSLRAEVSS